MDPKDNLIRIKDVEIVVESKDEDTMQSPDPLYSPAQVAIVRVFSRCMEVSLDHGIVSSLGNGVSVSARILVASNQVSSMLDENGRVALDISIASGAEIKLTGVDDLPSCAGVNDNVVQISGDYENVKSTLFQLAGKLRENFFSGTGPRGTDCIHSSYSAIPSNGPNGREAASSIHLVQRYKLSDIDKLEQGETTMSSSQLKDLLNFWNLEEVQKRSRINKESSESQRDRHTTGPVSFARTRHALEQAKNEPPSEARMYYETRKRTSGRTYKTTYEVIEDNINQMKGGQSQKQRKLLGRCTKRVKGPSNSSVLILDEFLEPYRAQIVKDTAAEIMRPLKQQLPSEIFSHTTTKMLNNNTDTTTVFCENRCL